ncbi:hypothetical protein AB0G74_16870 [Streptomyces sp. NPDC020875]|uniref:hypothetical protein n=1 Tax=Streptomyces sp. NPDC020875 TaxID=3154898 RepID=UPI0033F9CB0F
MTPRRRPLGPGPVPQPDAERQEHEDDARTAPRIHAAEADLDDRPLYQPDIGIDDLRARGVLGPHQSAAAPTTAHRRLCSGD